MEYEDRITISTQQQQQKHTHDMWWYTMKMCTLCCCCCCTLSVCGVTNLMYFHSPHYFSFSNFQCWKCICFCCCQGFCQSLWWWFKMPLFWNVCVCVCPPACPITYGLIAFGFALKFGGLNAVGVKHPFSISVSICWGNFSAQRDNARTCLRNILLNRSASSIWKWGLKLNSIEIEIELNWARRRRLKMLRCHCTQTHTYGPSKYIF